MNPFPNGTRVRLEMARFSEDPWEEGVGPVGVVAAVSYGEPADGTPAAYYHVRWDQPSWVFHLDGEPRILTFSSEPGASGVHFRRHDRLRAVPGGCDGGKPTTQPCERCKGTGEVGLADGDITCPDCNPLGEWGPHEGPLPRCPDTGETSTR